jgi:hypothetical protein
MPRTTVTAIIPAGQSLSDVIDCRNGAPILIYMPAEFTSARLSYLMSYDNNTYCDLFDRNAKEIAHNVQPGTVLKMGSDWTDSALGGYLKLRSGSRDHPILQEQTRQFMLVIDTSV